MSQTRRLWGSGSISREHDIDFPITYPLNGNVSIQYHPNLPEHVHIHSRIATNHPFLPESLTTDAIRWSNEYILERVSHELGGPRDGHLRKYGGEDTLVVTYNEEIRRLCDVKG